MPQQVLTEDVHDDRLLGKSWQRGEQNHARLADCQLGFSIRKGTEQAKQSGTDTSFGKFVPPRHS